MSADGTSDAGEDSGSPQRRTGSRRLRQYPAHLGNLAPCGGPMARSAGGCQGDLLSAQARGRVYAAELVSFSGQLDLSLDQDVMGQVGIRPELSSRRLQILATNLPKKSSVEIWQIPVDLGGFDDEPGGVIATLPCTAFSGGLAALDVDTTTDCAFAVTVRTSGGKRVGGSNPIWHCQAEPAWTIPDNRRAN